MLMLEEMCRISGGKVVGNLCIIRGVDKLRITNFKEKNIEIPNNVLRLFFRFPHEIKVEREINNKTRGISTFKEMSVNYYFL